MILGEHAIPLIKILFVGNTNVGKTQLFNRWAHNKFSNAIVSTTAFDFHCLPLENINMQLWDTPGAGLLASQVASFIRGSQIICIVVSATDSKKDKLIQINHWIEIINANISKKPAIVILENKMELANTSALTINDLEPLNGQFTLYKAVSAKQEINLTEILQPVLQPIIQAEAFKQKNNYYDDEIPLANKEVKRLNPTNRVDYDLTKQRINGLTDNQAYIILHSLLNALIYGPLNKKDTPYDIKFSGGKSLTLDDKTQITVSEHAFNWISKIQVNPLFSNQSKTILAELYDEIDQAAAAKPFSRSNSTHVFYNHSLTGFIAHTVKKDPLNPNLDYISLKWTIDDLPAEKINTILHELITRLEKGVSLNNDGKPYNVGFWGGRKHISSITKQKIKVPEHIGALLEYLTTTTDTPRDKLLRALDSVLITSYSTNSSRDVTTQNFYTNLPRDLMNRINDLHIHPEARSINHQGGIN